jgi:hypothetical protein
MREQMPLLRRFLSKIVHDVLPAALASVIGGFLFTHFQLGWAPAPVAAQVAPASAEIMGLLRDEHALVLNYLKAQVANEKQRLAADDGARIAVEPQPTLAVSASRPVAVAMAAARPLTARGKSPVAGAPLPPLVIAQEQRHEGLKQGASNVGPLLAKTIDIKDQVVAVGQRVVSVIGGIPSWIGSIGEHIGESPSPSPSRQLLSTS